MVFVLALNPPSDASDPQSFEAFKALAISRSGTVAATQSAPAGASTIASASNACGFPSPPAWAGATATVSWGGTVYTTTYTSYEGTPEPTPTERRIIVGADGQLSYIIAAAIGDTIIFEFRPKNHTVTQSSFSDPCSPLANGLTPGFQPVAADATIFPTFSFKVNDTAPIWGYCGQDNHCQAGMVFSINAVDSGPNSFAAFQQLAKRPATAFSSNSGDSNGSPGGGNQPSSAVMLAGPGLVAATLAFAGFVTSFL